ncbi:MAG: TIR domain-containing protein, partial [Bacteroidota bacterium]
MPKTRFFISYRTKDEKAKLLHERLRGVYGADLVFFDKEKLPTGSNWAKRLEEGVKNADAVIAVLGPYWCDASSGGGVDRLHNEGDWVRKELELAFEHGKPIFPVLLDVKSLPSKQFLPEKLKALHDIQCLTIDSSKFEREVKQLIADLREMGFGVEKEAKTQSATGVENDRGAIHLNRKKVRYDLTEKDVLGRAEELEKLLTLLKDSKSLVLVSGLGGIGKTTLVNYYLSRYQAAYKHIGWVSCTGDFKNDVLASLDNEDALGKDESSDLEARFQNKLLQLQKLSGNNLLVIDNINTPAEAQEVLQYKDRFPNNFQLLMTARVALQGYPTHQIGVLEEADAIDLFKKHYTFKKGDSEDQLQTLLKHIGRHTLVIEMLAKGMAMSGRMNLARMSERIREKGLQSIKVEASTQRAGGQNKRLNEFVAEVLDLSFQDINEENWLLLQQLVVLPPVAHEFDLLIHLLGCDEEEAQDQLDAQLSRLQKRGLLEYQAENIQLHPVLREVVLEKSNLEYEHLAIIVERLDDILYYDNNNPKHQLADRQPLIIYGDAIVEQVQDLEEEKVSELLDDLGGVYEEFGQYHKAAKLRE